MKIIKKYFLVFFFSSMLVACGGGGGGDSTVNPSLPGDATRITTVNATDIANSAVASVIQTSALTALRQEEKSASTADVINLIIDQAFGQYKLPNSIALRTDTFDCDSGTFTITANETETSATGKMTFNSCDFAGLVIDGSFSFSMSFNTTTGAYSSSGNGKLSFSDGVQNASIEMNYSDSGNFNDGSFSKNMSISVSGVPGENFLLTTTQDITGVGFDVLSGQIIVEGAEGTRLRITFSPTNQAVVELDEGSGSFAPHSTITF